MSWIKELFNPKAAFTCQRSAEHQSARGSELINSTYQSLEIVSRYRDAQFQVTKNQLNLLNLIWDIYDYR